MNKRWAIIGLILVLCMSVASSALANGPGKHGAGRKRGVHPTTPVTQITMEEGVVIDVGDTGINPYWVAWMLRRQGYQLDLIGPHLTVKVQTTWGSSCSSSAGTSGGVYAYFKSTIYLDARSTSSFSVMPEQVVAHEYGHAWTLYHLYLTHNNDYGPWLDIRGLTGDPRLETSYRWAKNEMMADDYRLLFGYGEQALYTNYMNRDIDDPRTVPGLKDWYMSVWGPYPEVI